MIITAEDSHARVSHLRLVLKPTLDTTVSHPAWLCAHCRPSTLLPSLLIGPAMNPILVWRKLLESTRGWAGPKESFNGSSYLQGLESAEELNSYMLRWYHRSSYSFSQVILLVSPCFPPCFQFQIKRAGDPRGNMLNQTLGPARASICSSLRSCSSYSCGFCLLGSKDILKNPGRTLPQARSSGGGSNPPVWPVSFAEKRHKTADPLGGTGASALARVTLFPKLRFVFRNRCVQWGTVQRENHSGL